MSISRRQFLKHIGCACGAAAVSNFLQPSLLMAQSCGSGNGKNIVLINLAGGCDGLSLFPYYQGDIANELLRIRPTITTPINNILTAHAQNGSAAKVGIHPALAPIRDSIITNGKIVQKYGITANVGRSHDISQLIMDLGTSRSTPSEKGFLAKFADHLNFQLYQYWGFSSSAGYFAFNTDRAVPLVVSDLDHLDQSNLWSNWGEEDNEFFDDVKRSLIEAEVPTGEAQEKYKRSAITMHEAVLKVRNDIATQTVGTNAAGNYTTSGIGKSLKDTAKVIKAKNNLPELGIADKLSVIYLTQGGYDHHSGLANANSSASFPRIVSVLASNLAVFIEDLKSVCAWEDTTIILFSEFGRTSFENGAAGSSATGADHGWGSNTLVLGGSVTPGVVGDYPTVAELGNKNVNALTPTTDYRDIFGDVFNWVGVDPKIVFDEAGYTNKNLGLFT